MKKDLFKEFGEASEREFLRQNDLKDVVGGVSSPVITIMNPYIGCGGSLKNSLDFCPGNVCDPFNCGACAGNTVLGGPRTCPL